MASLKSTAPGGIVTDAVPPNVTGRSDPDAIPDSSARMPTWAAPIVNGAVPNALLNTRRARDPPMLVWTIWRTVWLLNDWIGCGSCTRCAPSWPGGCSRLNDAGNVTVC